MPNRQQSEEFIEEVAPDALQTAIDWIAKNMSPEEVFPEKDLKDWAENAGFVEAE